MTRFMVKLFIAAATLCIAGLFVSNPAFSKSHHPRHRHHSHCHRLVWEGDYEIQNLDDIDAIYGYIGIRGNLSIVFEDNDTIPSLEGLECLRHISGDLIISNYADFDSESPARDLYGLNHLKSVRGTLDIYSLGLLSLEGLDSLRTVGSLVLTGSVAGPGVTSLKGLENLISIKGELNIYEMNELVNLEGLENLREIRGTLVLGENGLFENFIGLDSLRFLGGIFIDEQCGPYNFLGLGNLKSIGSMQIYPGCYLENFEGLNNLESITGHLFVMASDWGPGLTSLDGLQNLRYVGGNFSFYDNYDLCTGLIENLRDQILDSGGIGGNIDIDNNKDCD